MPAAYRDETESLLAKNRELEEKLAERNQEIAALKERLADHDAVFHRLENVLDAKSKASRPKRFLVIGGGIMAGLALLGTMAAARSAKRAPIPTSSAQALDLPPRDTAKLKANPVPIPTGDLCTTPGVRLNVDGDDAFAPASSDRDLAGHKYSRGGSRSPWFTVNSSLQNGSLYVHGVGALLSGDLGTTNLSLMTIMVKGESGGYELARGGRSMVEVTRSDGKLIAGRFEADMSRVPDTTREPPFGTPVVRVRGTFCLPAYPADPNDTGP